MSTREHVIQKLLVAAGPALNRQLLNLDLRGRQLPQDADGFEVALDLWVHIVVHIILDALKRDRDETILPRFTEIRLGFAPDACSTSLTHPVSSTV